MAQRSIAVLATVVAMVFGAAGAHAAQGYPERLIKVIVPYPAGGPIDVTARIVTQRLAPMLGQPIIIENRAGASGLVGMKIAAAAEPDGYTLLFGNASTLTVFPAITHSRDFDTLKQLAPIAKLIEGYEVLAVDPAGPAGSLPQLIVYAKANPGRLNYGSAGFGNLTHLAGEWLKLKAGIDVVHVPYKGAPEAVAGLVSGQIQMTFGEISGLLPLGQQGKVRLIGIASAARDPKAPDVPTFIEQGIPDFVATTFTAVLAPAGTPMPILVKLHDAINATLMEPETRAALENLGSTIHLTTIAEFTALLATERRKWEGVVTLAGIKAD